MVWLNLCRFIPHPQILQYSFFITATKRKSLITNQINWINFFPRFSKTISTYQKSQKDELEYHLVQNWSPNEVNIFLKERFAEDWKTLKKFGFEKYQVTGSMLLELKADDLYKAGLPFLIAKKLEDIIKPIVPKKTIYIQAYNDEGEPLEKFEKYTMHDEDDLRNFLKSVEGKGLESIEDNNEIPNVITSLRDINNNQYYRINSIYLTAVRKGVIWTKIEVIGSTKCSY